MNVTFRPVDEWPQPRTEQPRRSQFKAGYQKTLRQLDFELWHLGATSVVIQLYLEEHEIRLDGMPRAHARPSDSGVILSFESKHGPLRYLTDVFDHWEDNVRAIALGLEALRKVDRYGISKRGEQYTGWRALESGEGLGITADALDVITRYSGFELESLENPDNLRRAIRRALRRTHPDQGGNPAAFARVQEARQIVEGGES